MVAPPQISINATYPGASAGLVTDAATSVIEEELNGTKDLLYFESSSSSTGNADITVTFKPGTDPSLAEVDVQNRLKKAEARLPESVTRTGMQVEQAASNFLMMYALTYKVTYRASPRRAYRTMRRATSTTPDCAAPASHY